MNIFFLLPRCFFRLTNNDFIFQKYALITTFINRRLFFDKELERSNLYASFESHNVAPFD